MKKKKKVELEKVSHMKRQGIKCEKGKIIDESWNIQVRDDSLRKIFENQFKPMARLLNGKQVVKKANQFDVPSIVKTKNSGKVQLVGGTWWNQFDEILIELLEGKMLE